MSKPRWTNFLNPADVAATTGQERHSQRANPLFRNGPTSQAIAPMSDANTTDRLILRLNAGNASMADFRVGDHIEINGDGILRRITAVTDTIQFTPPLPQRPFRDAFVWNWKAGTSTALDLRPRPGSPALAVGQDGKPVGANLDIAAFQRGDFYGTGT